MVPSLVRAIPLLEVPLPAHSHRGRWVLVGGREALNDKNNFKKKLFNAVVISWPTEVASFPASGNSPRVGNHGPYVILTTAMHISDNITSAHYCNPFQLLM